MDRLYHTTGSSPQKQQQSKYSQIYYQRFKQMSSQPQSTHGHQSQSSVELSDSAYTFEHRIRTNTQDIVVQRKEVIVIGGQLVKEEIQVITGDIAETRDMRDSKSIKQIKDNRPGSNNQSYRSQQSIQLQRNKILLVRQLGEIMGIPNISLNDLKLKIKAITQQNTLLKQRSNQNSLNQSQHKSLTSINSQISKRHQKSEADRVIQRKNEIMSLVVRNLNQQVDKHRREIEEVYERLLTIGINSGIALNQTKDFEGIVLRIQWIKERVFVLQADNNNYQLLSVNQSSKIRELQITINELLSQMSTLKSEIESLTLQRAQAEEHIHEIHILRQNEERYKERISYLEQNQSNLHSNLLNRSKLLEYQNEDTPNFKQQQSHVRDLNISLLKNKEEQNKMLIQTIQQLNQKLEAQMEERLKYSVASTISTTELKNYCKQLEGEVELLRRQRETMDRSAQNFINNSKISERSIQSHQRIRQQEQIGSELKMKYQQVSSLNNKLIEQNSLLRTKVDQMEIGFQKERETSKIDQLNSVISDMSSLKKDLMIKSQQLQTTLRILQSKQQQVELYNKLIGEKNIEIQTLRSQLNTSSLEQPQQFLRLKKQIFTLQQSLKHSLQTHERHVSLTTSQINTLKQIGINLQKQNSELLEMVREYEEEIAKMIHNGYIQQRPESLKSEEENQRFNVRASEIKKELDTIVASIENRKSKAEENSKAEEVKASAAKSEFRNPFETSKSNSAINYSPITGMRINQDIIKVQQQQIPSTILYQQPQQYRSNYISPKNNLKIVQDKAIHEIFPNKYLPPEVHASKLLVEQRKTHLSPEQRPKAFNPPTSLQIQHLSNKQTAQYTHVPSIKTHSNSQSKLIILDRKKSTSRQKSIPKIQSPYLTSPKFSHKPIIQPHKIQQTLSSYPSVTSMNSIPSRIINQSPPITTTTISPRIQKSVPTSVINSPYFHQSKNMKSIPETQMESSSKLSIRIAEPKVEVSKPNTTPESIYNLEGYGNYNINNREALEKNQSQQSGRRKDGKELGIRMYQVDSAPKSDCC